MFSEGLGCSKIFSKKKCTTVHILGFVRIENCFDRLEDCYVVAIITSPPFTMEQMMTRAIMAIQLTGLYSQSLIE